jgi:tetratricopeptide (TPR) repeat protein
MPYGMAIRVAQIRRDLQSWPGFKYQNWQIAAQFCASRKINLEEALVWADKALTEPFKTYLGLAQGYTAVGDKENAIKNWETALANVPANAKSDVPTYQNALRQLKEGK